MPVTARYCNRCGVRISPLELESGEAARYEGQYYCAGCAREVIPVAREAQEFRKPESPPHRKADFFRSVTPKQPASPVLPTEGAKEKLVELKISERKGPLAVGRTFSLFDGRMLSGWKKVGNVTCKVENGEMVVKNNSVTEEGGVFTNYREQRRWFDYEFAISINSSLAAGWRLVLRAGFLQSGAVAGHSLRAGKGFTADTWQNIAAEVTGNNLYVTMGGLRRLLSRTVREKPGAVAVLVKPGGEVRIRDVKFTLRAVK